MAYHPVIAAKIIEFKRQPERACAVGLTTPLIPMIEGYEQHCDALIPMPQHWRRKLLRPLNPATVIAHTLSARMHLRTDTRFLRRSRYTQHQFGCSPRVRRKQQRNSFRAQKANYKHIALVDDVITTGATVEAAIRAINRQNPHCKISIFAVARADS